jgi:hypothetical protein
VITRTLAILLLLAGSARGAITGSVIVEDRAQADGRRWIRERHTDHTGEVHFIVYMAAAGANATTAMTNRVALIEEQLAAAEMSRNISQIDRDGIEPLNPVITLQHTTIDQLGAEVRARFQSATGAKAAVIAEWLLTRTDAQLRNAFGMTQTQVNSLKTRLQSKVTILTNLRNQTGE